MAATFSLRSIPKFRAPSPIARACRLAGFHVSPHRGFASAPSGTVSLDYTLHSPPSTKGTSDEALVILHGLFGSKRNWGTLARRFAEILGMPVYALDLRNQGDSPHAQPMTYDCMAGDVLEFLERHKLSNITLMGHSMGGKVAMAAALHPTSLDIKNLIVVDIAPVKGKISDDFRGYVEAMRKIEELGLKSRKEAMDYLKAYEPSPETRMFLLTNMYPISDKHPTCKFRVPLNILHESVPDIGDFPYTPGERTWEGRTLFVKGMKSRYINDRNLPVAESFFPGMKVEKLDTGHWVHAESPGPFSELVCKFVKEG